MKSLEFPGATIKIGAGQTDIYNVIHAYPLNDDRGEVMAIYELTPVEVAQIMESGKIYYSRLTFGSKCTCHNCGEVIPTGFQPMRISTEPIEIVVQMNGPDGNLMPEKYQAFVTDKGVQVIGWDRQEDGSYKKIEA